MRCMSLTPKNNWETWLNFSLPMRLIYKNRILCKCGNKLDTPLQTDFALHVSIPSILKSDLQTLIDMFFEKELIEDYKCDSPDCDGKGAHRAAILCRPLPRTICIHLQRSYWNGYKMIKKCGKIPFTDTLIIKSEICFDRPSSERQSEQPKDQNSDSQQDDSLKKKIIDKPDKFDISLDSSDSSDNQSRHNVEKDNYDSKNLKGTDGEKSSPVQSIGHMGNEIYRLSSIIVHLGTVYSGHYICYKCVDNIWFLTDDSRIRQVDETKVFNCEAYILFYESDL